MMNVKRKNKNLSKIFSGISIVLFFVFLAGLFSMVMSLVFFVESDYYNAKLCAIYFILSVVVAFPLSSFFLDLSLDFDPDPPKYEIIDRREPPYKDWY